MCFFEVSRLLAQGPRLLVLEFRTQGSGIRFGLWGLGEYGSGCKVLVFARKLESFRHSIPDAKS